MPVDVKEFVEKEINISNMLSIEEVIEAINNEEIEDNKYYKVIFTGYKNMEININQILRNVVHRNIIKIKDETSLEINLEEISKQNSLKGLFVKNLLEEIDRHSENEEIIKKAIEIGINVF